MPERIVRIPKSSLPIEADTESYILRYRIVSEDRNRFSAWSPIYRVVAPTINEILVANNLTGPGAVDSPVYTPTTISTPAADPNDPPIITKVFNIFWNAPEIFNQNEVRAYDLYIKWGNYDPVADSVVYDGDYEYAKKVSAASLNYTKPSEKASYDRVSLWVQSETYPKKIVSSQRLYSIEDREF